MWRGSRCRTMPVTMSPFRPSYSPKVTSRSASRSRCTITCLAVTAAIRPKSEGVSSHSRTTCSFSSSSCAYTLTSPLLRSTTTRASSGALGRRLYAAARALSRAVMTVSSEMPFSRSRNRSSSIGMFTSPSSRQGWESGGLDHWLSPRQHHLSSHHYGQRHPELVAAHLERHHLLVGSHHDPAHLAPGLVARGLSQDQYLVPALPPEVAPSPQRTIQSRGGHLERVATRQWIVVVERARQALGDPLDHPGIDRLVRVEHP